MAVVDILTISQSPQMGKGPGSLELLYIGRERLVYNSRERVSGGWGGREKLCKQNSSNSRREGERLLQTALTSI